MMGPAMDYLKAACLHTGIPPARVAVGRAREESYRTAPAAVIVPLSGRLRRDGSRIVAGPHRTRRSLYHGQGRIRLELYARTRDELDQLIVGILLYLWEYPLRVGDNLYAKLDEITVSYVDDEGVLLGEHGAALEIPVELAVHEDTPWIPIHVEVEDSLIEEV